jgi:hypothetical protein
MVFHDENGVKHGEVLSSLLFNFTVEFSIKKEGEMGVKLNGTH